MEFIVYFETQFPSKKLFVIPQKDRKFIIESFYTSHSNFKCYKIKIEGNWIAYVDGEKKKGVISSFFNGYGLRADTESEIELNFYPKLIVLRNFRWHGNSGGIYIPNLVDEIIDNIPIRVTANMVRTGQFNKEKIMLKKNK